MTTLSAIHTPGPWDIRYVERANVNITAENGGITVARVQTGQTAWYLGQVEANALLIAAAPDLLEALKTVRSLLPPDSMMQRVIGPGAWKQIDAAIARAEP